MELWQGEELIKAIRELTKAVKNLDNNIGEKMTENAKLTKDVADSVDALVGIISLKPFN